MRGQRIREWELLKHHFCQSHLTAEEIKSGKQETWLNHVMVMLRRETLCVSLPVYHPPNHRIPHISLPLHSVHRGSPFLSLKCLILILSYISSFQSFQFTMNPFLTFVHQAQVAKISAGTCARMMSEIRKKT